jgi:hypothetical protein
MASLTSLTSISIRDARDMMPLWLHRNLHCMLYGVQSKAEIVIIHAWKDSPKTPASSRRYAYRMGDGSTQRACSWRDQNSTPLNRAEGRQTVNVSGSSRLTPGSRLMLGALK